MTSMSRVLRALPPLAETDDPSEGSAGDQAFVEVVRSWLRAEITGDEGLVARLADMAVAAWRDGASVEETYAWTRSLARSWLRHPSYVTPRPHLRLVTAC